MSSSRVIFVGLGVCLIFLFVTGFRSASATGMSCYKCDSYQNGSDCKDWPDSAKDKYQVDCATAYGSDHTYNCCRKIVQSIDSGYEGAPNTPEDRIIRTCGWEEPDNTYYTDPTKGSTVTVYTCHNRNYCNGQSALSAASVIFLLVAASVVLKLIP